MKILLVYPKTPSTFWSFESALNFISKKSAEPPLGLITIAAMLPKTWDLKLIDMNVSELLDEDIVFFKKNSSKPNIRSNFKEKYGYIPTGY